MATIVIIIIVIVTIVVVIVTIVVAIVIITQHLQARPDQVAGLGGNLHFALLGSILFRWHYANFFFCCNIGFCV